MRSTTVERLLDMACAIQQIPAPPFGEEVRAAFVASEFKKAGLSDVHTDAPGNVYARLPGGGGALPVVVSAHLDTVFPLMTDLGIKKDGDRIYGPGIGDNSLAVAALFGLVWELAHAPGSMVSLRSALPGDLWLVANVGEEGLGNLRGMRAVVEKFKDQVKAYIVLEGLALGQLYHRGLGSVRFRIITRTAGGHSWKDYGEPSAIHELAKLIVQLTGIVLPTEPRTTLNVGVISGGTSINTVAPEAQLELDLRSEEQAALEALVTRVNRLVKAVNGKGVEVVAQEIGNRPSGSIPRTHPLVQLAQKNITDHGMQPSLAISSTDANIPLSLGYPAICVGISTGSGAHTVGEYIQAKPVEGGLAQLVSLVCRIFSEL